LTSHQETDITTTIQRRRQRPRHTGRNRSEQVVAIVGMPTELRPLVVSIASAAILGSNFRRNSI
jgi:hypothetical protein